MKREHIAGFTKGQNKEADKILDAFINKGPRALKQLLIRMGMPYERRNNVYDAMLRFMFMTEGQTIDKKETD